MCLCIRIMHSLASPVMGTGVRAPTPTPSTSNSFIFHSGANVTSLLSIYCAPGPEVHCECRPVWGRGTPLPPCPFTSSFSPFYFFVSFLGFTYFLLLSIPSLSTRIVPLRFQAVGRRRRSNLGLVCVLFCNLCYLYSLVKMDSGVLFYLV